MNTCRRLVITLALGLGACADDASKEKAALASHPPPTKAELRAANQKSLREFLAQAQSPAQVFRLPTGRPVRVRGAGGTSVWVPANAFARADNGQAVRGAVELKLRECYTLADALLQGLATQAGPQLLATGGMVHLAASADGRPCVLRPGVAVGILFPAFRPEPGMRLFVGQAKDGRGPANWQLPARPLAASSPLELAGSKPRLFSREGITDVGNPEQYIWRTGCPADAALARENARFAEAERRRSPRDIRADSVTEIGGYLLTTSQLEWINCDRFLDRPAAALFDYTLTSDGEPMEIVLVFRNFRGLMHGEQNGSQVKFPNVARGEPATLVAMRWANGQIELAARPLTLGVGPEPALAFRPVTRAELLTEFHKLDPQHRWETPVSMPKLMPKPPCGGYN